MSDSAPVTKTFACKLCGQQVLVEFTPNEFISESFIRNSFICSNHGKAKQKPRSEIKVNAPYRDD